MAKHEVADLGMIDTSGPLPSFCSSYGTLSGLVLRGHLGLCHLRIGFFEKCVTLDIAKSSRYKVIFFDFLHIICKTVHLHPMIFFYKNGRIFAQSPKPFKVFGACCAKNVSLQLIFPIFRRLWCRKMCHFRPRVTTLLAGAR